MLTILIYKNYMYVIICMMISIYINEYIPSNIYIYMFKKIRANYIIKKYIALIYHVAINICDMYILLIY